MNALRNKISESGLIQIDLDQFLPNLIWKGVDIANFLEEGGILREKNFRERLKNWDISEYQESSVFIYCSQEAIFPEWTYLAISAHLSKVTDYRFVGNEKEAKRQLLQQSLLTHDYEQYKNQSLIIKGCSNSIANTECLMTFFNGCLPYAKSIMFGEACASVPIYKKPKT